MNTEAKTSRWNLKKVAMALAVGVTVAGATAAPAMAEDWHHGRYERHWDRHVYRPYAYGYGYGYRYYPAPSYVYSPPAYYGYAAPSLNFVIPLHIR